MKEERNYLDFKARVAILKELERVCGKHGDFAIYQPGENDRTVAERMGCTVANVAGIRNQMIGPVRGAPAPAQGESDLEKRLARIESFLARAYGFTPEPTAAQANGQSRLF